ncbi:MAG TPA: transglycosylase domain-containing protein, partial [Chloroflexota bacterium]|nr:transglycosylase domain-containing protein [Chloroflexota bacterium]
MTWPGLIWPRFSRLDWRSAALVLFTSLVLIVVSLVVVGLALLAIVLVLAAIALAALIVFVVAFSISAGTAIGKLSRSVLWPAAKRIRQRGKTGAVTLPARVMRSRLVALLDHLSGPYRQPALTGINRLQAGPRKVTRRIPLPSAIRHPRRRTILAIGAVCVLLPIGLVAVDAVGVAARSLPPVDEVFAKQTFQSAFIYDRKGRVLFELTDPNGGRRTMVPVQQIPKNLTAATIATEDANFYQNSGIDPVAILRSLARDVINRRIETGASTITQQLVRNVLMTPEERRSQSIGRKIAEAILAIRVTQRYSKDEILDRYLNEIYYGNLAYGADAAAKTYFDRPVSQLTLAQAALLAGLPQAPALYDPYQHPEAAKERQREVLHLMVAHHFITQSEADAADAEPLEYSAEAAVLQAPHFVVDVRGLLEERFTSEQIYDGGLRVYTSLDLDLQRQAEQIIRSRLAALPGSSGPNAAAVVLDARSGEVLAMVGSADFNSAAIHGQINMALVPRPAGSLIEPFTYLVAFDDHLAAPATVIDDAPVSYPMGGNLPPYRPQNPDGTFHGPVTVRRALTTSLTVPAVLTLNRVGIATLLTTLRRFGITTLPESPDYYGLSLTVGGAPVTLLDLTQAYAGLANAGVPVGEDALSGQSSDPRLAPVTILKVTDAKGNLLSAYGPVHVPPAVSPQAAWLVTDILATPTGSDDADSTAAEFQFDQPVAVKTGLAEGRTDGWTIGYTPEIVVGVWVGNASGEALSPDEVAAGTAIWHDLMAASRSAVPSTPFVQPSGLVRATVDTATGLLAVPGRPSTTDWFIAGTVPTR